MYKGESICGNDHYYTKGCEEYFTWELVFDTQFLCVLSGNLVVREVDGEEDVTTAGEDFCYVNGEH